MRIHIVRGSERFGPYTYEQSRKFLASGHLRADDSAWLEGGEGWQPLAYVLHSLGEQRKKDARTTRYILIGVAAAVLMPTTILGIFNAIVTSDRQAARREEPRSAVLNATVRQTPFGITLTNGRGITYEDVTVKINYGLWGDYEAKLGRVPAGETATIPYSMFTNSSNERFNYDTTAVKSVMVRARVEGALGYEEFGLSK
jgi:hypothetical protein